MSITRVPFPKVAAAPPVQPCVLCGARRARASRLYCVRHRFVSLTCAGCGKRFSISRNEFAARTRQKAFAKTPLGYFCSRECYLTLPVRLAMLRLAAASTGSGALAGA